MEHRTRNYETEQAELSLQSKPASSHPLETSVEAHHGGRELEGFAAKRGTRGEQDAQSKNEIMIIDDPLGVLSLHSDRPSMSAAADIVDPPGTSYANYGARGRSIGGERVSSSRSFSTSHDRASEAAAEWDAKKSSIMHRFASSGTITVSATFDIVSKDSRGGSKSVTTLRLEELEDPSREAREEVKIISQQEYVTRLRELNNEIAQAWLNNERVTALRLTIKVAKLLLDTSVPQFYPTLFVLVTDVMDTVGGLVWNRIKAKAESDDQGRLLCTLPAAFTAADVRQEAKDTCNNWFYKIGSIRELLPRLYMEMALLRCVHFLEVDPPIARFQRLAAMARGISDPLAAAYVRLYLARRAQAVMPFYAAQKPGPVLRFGDAEDPRQSYAALLTGLGLPVPSAIPSRPQGYLFGSLQDFLVLYRRVLGGEFEKQRRKAGVEQKLYLQLLEPPIDWMMHCLFKSAPQELIDEAMTTFGGMLDNSPPPIAIVVHQLLRHLPASYVATSALQISSIVKNATDISLPQSQNYQLLGTKLAECSPPRDLRLPVLNDVWKVVTKISELTEYLMVVDTFIEYVLQNFSTVEVNVLLKDVRKHLGKNKATDAELAVLESIIFKLVTHYDDLLNVLSLAHFADILDVFYGDLQGAVYRRILTAVARGRRTISDPVVLNFLFELCRTMHDSLDSTATDDDLRQTARLVSRFIQQVDFGKDLERHLNFLVDCRAAFASFDPAREAAVHASNRLAMRALQARKGVHNRRTLEFTKACIAFDETTIPSIAGIILRLHLFLESSEVALQNGLLLHAEGLMKSAITSLQEAQAADAVAAAELATAEGEEQLVLFLRKLASFLVVLPGHPEQGGFYLLKALLTVLGSHSWQSAANKVHAYAGLLLMTSAHAQENLPYHVQNELVESNDTLFCEDEAYSAELAELTAGIVQQAVTALEGAPATVAVAHRALDLCNTLLLTFEINSRSQAITSEIVSKWVPVLPKSDTHSSAILEYARAMATTRQSL